MPGAEGRWACGSEILPPGRVRCDGETQYASKTCATSADPDARRPQLQGWERRPARREEEDEEEEGRRGGRRVGLEFRQEIRYAVPDQWAGPLSLSLPS